MRNLLDVIVIVLLLPLFVSHIDYCEAISQCTTKSTNCTECLSFHRNCAWCQQEDYNTTNSRCDEVNVLSSRCKADSIVWLDNNFTIVEDAPLTDATNSVSDMPVIQMRPQIIKLKLRPRASQKVTVRFQQNNQALDLYYLMDYTATMAPHKEGLAKLSELLGNTLKNLTARYRLGLGSFVDKPVMPYVNMLPDVIERPCLSSEGFCVPAYAFRNHLGFTNDNELFFEEIRNSHISANVDAPEGGLDALMQIGVCQEKIAWDSQARHLVVYVTDGTFHYAGDGKLGGIVAINDEKCHLDDDGFYTYSTIQDYPSLSQIDRILQQKKINVIFAVMTSGLTDFHMMSKLMSAQTYVSELQTNDDATEVVKLINEVYQDISSMVRIRHNASNPINIRTFSKCLNYKEEVETDSCDEVHNGDIVEFTLELEAMEYPHNASERRQRIVLEDANLDASLVIDVEILELCQCEQQVVEAHEHCSGIGKYSCGVCQCPPTHAGLTCQCDVNRIGLSADDRNATVDYMQLCRAENELPGQECSNRGQCFCGECVCDDPRYHGRYCECDNSLCTRTADGLLCGGPEKGICDCGKCACLPGWTGPDCNCPDRNDTCLPETPGAEHCSGNGECVCGKCNCHVSTQQGRYGGKYCEDCDVCGGFCDEYRYLVECEIHKIKESCTGNYDDVSPTLVESFDEWDKDHISKCLFAGPEDCTYEFRYFFGLTNEPVIIATEMFCPLTVASAMTVAGLIVALVVLIGLVVVLIFRVTTYVQDRREYQRFNKEREEVQFGTEINPLFKSPITTFEVPEAVRRLHSEEETALDSS